MWLCWRETKDTQLWRVKKIVCHMQVCHQNLTLQALHSTNISLQPVASTWQTCSGSSSRLELNGHGPLQDRDRHRIGKVQSNSITHEGVPGDRHWWIICQGVGGICSFIKPFQEYLGTASPFNLTLLSLFIVAHMNITTHVHWHVR